MSRTPLPLNTLPVRWLILSLLFPVTANAGVWEVISGKSAYPLTESGYYTVDSRQIHWLDDNRVLFTGGPLPQWEKVVVKEKRPFERAIYIWNTNEKTVTKLSSAPGYCYYKGVIRYTVSLTDKEYVYMEGPVGKETEHRRPRVEISEEWRKEHGEQLHPMTCGKYKLSDVRIADKMFLFPLMEGHGFLGWEGGGETPWPAGGEAPVRYYKDATTPPIMLPLKRKDIRVPSSAFPPIYAEWANVYVLQGEAEWGRPPTWANYLPKDQPYPVYLIKPDSSEVTTLHAWYQKGVGNWQYFYTKAGLLVFSSAVKGGGLGDAGIYRVVDRGYEKILQGIPHTGAISPDGCRFAFGIQYIGQKSYGPIELKVLDLCKGAN